MASPALLRLVAAMVLTTITLLPTIPAQARVDDFPGPHWFDQTVYRPNCVPTDCACDCRSERLCLPACVRW
jgi:hypothetical protein